MGGGGGSGVWVEMFDGGDGGVSGGNGNSSSGSSSSVSSVEESRRVACATKRVGLFRRVVGSAAADGFSVRLRVLLLAADWGWGGGAGKVKAGSSGSLGVLSCSAGFVKMRVNLLCRCVNLMCRCVNLMCRCVNLMCRCLARCSQVTTQVGLAISRHLLILRATSVHILLEMRV